MSRPNSSRPCGRGDVLRRENDPPDHFLILLILDKLSSHKSPKATEMRKDVGAWFLYLPPYSPDLNPIEMAFAKLKTLIRKAAARTYDALRKAVGNVCNLFTEQECSNSFQVAGYEAD